MSRQNKQHIEFKYYITAKVGGPKWISLLRLWTRIHPIAAGGGAGWLWMCGWVWTDVGTIFIWGSPSGPLCSQKGHYVKAGVSCSNLQPHVPLRCCVCIDPGRQSRSGVFWLHTVGSCGVLDVPFSFWDLFSSSVSTRPSFSVSGVPDSDTILQVLSVPAPWGTSLCIKTILVSPFIWGEVGSGACIFAPWKLC